MKVSLIILIFIALLVSACTSLSSTGFFSSFENLQTNNIPTGWYYGSNNLDAEWDSNAFYIVSSDAVDGSKSLEMSLDYLTPCLQNVDCKSYRYGWIKSSDIKVYSNSNYKFSVAVKPSITNNNEADWIDVFIDEYSSDRMIKESMIVFNNDNAYFYEDFYGNKEKTVLYEDLGNGWKKLSTEFKTNENTDKIRLLVTIDNAVFKGNVRFDNFSIT